MSPKKLIIAPSKWLLWQFHHIRNKICPIIQGLAGIVRSNSDSENELEILNIGATVTLLQSERHRFDVRKDCAVVIENLQSTVLDNPSDENDNVQFQEDFGR